MKNNTPRLCSNRFLRFAKYTHIMFALGYMEKVRPWAVQEIHRMAAKHRQLIAEGY